jgi:hypothetical protein
VVVVAVVLVVIMVMLVGHDGSGSGVGRLGDGGDHRCSGCHDGSGSVGHLGGGLHDSISGSGFPSNATLLNILFNSHYMFRSYDHNENDGCDHRHGSGCHDGSVVRLGDHCHGGGGGCHVGCSQGGGVSHCESSAIWDPFMYK